MGVRARSLISTACLALVCAGCGTPPWQQQAVPGATSTTPSAARSTTTRPKPAPTPSARPTTVVNDLATGSARHKIEAGGVRLTINYWSTLPLDEWTAGVSKPLNLSASAKFIDGSKQNIFLSQVTVTIDVAGPTGPLTSPAALVDTASLAPGYLVKSPSSYGQVFTIGSLAATASSVNLALTYEMLAQTAPRSKTYAKQTASDTLVIPVQG
jgi:hypothetical protein